MKLCYSPPPRKLSASTKCYYSAPRSGTRSRAAPHIPISTELVRGAMSSASSPTACLTQVGHPKSSPLSILYIVQLWSSTVEQEICALV